MSLIKPARTRRCSNLEHRLLSQKAQESWSSESVWGIKPALFPKKEQRGMEEREEKGATDVAQCEKCLQIPGIRVKAMHVKRNSGCV